MTTAIQNANVLHLPVLKPQAKRAGIMTMAITARFRGGVVMCADRLVTHGDANYGQAFSQYANKTEWFFAEANATIAVCGATTDFDAMRSVMQAVSDKYDSFNPESNPPLQQVLELELERVLSRTGAQGLAIDLLAVHTKQGQMDAVYKCSGSHVVTASPFECIGIGDNSLVRYLSDNLYDHRATEEYAVAFSVYALKLGKHYVPQFVGGNTDVLVFRGGFCNELNAQRVKEIENGLDTTALGLKVSLDRISRTV